MTASDEPTAKSRYRFSRSTAPFYGIAVAVVVALAWLAYGDDNLLGVIGTLVSTIGVLLAWAIFDRQARDNESAERRAQRARDAVEERTRDQLSQTNLKVEAITDGLKQITTGLATEDDQADPYGDASDWIRKHGSQLDPDFDSVEASGIPLVVVADMVRGWERAGKKAGPEGGWRVGQLVAAIRKRGPGNFSWFVVTEGHATPESRVFRVSKGGQKNSLPTTTEIKDWETQLKRAVAPEAEEGEEAQGEA